MHRSRFDVHQRLLVQRVDREGERVRVVVRSPDEDEHDITFFFDDVDDAARHVATVERWRADRTPLTYVRRGTTGALLDDEATFRRAFEADLR